MGPPDHAASGDGQDRAASGPSDTGGSSPAVPALAGLTREHGIALLDRAAEIGLLTALGGGYYTIHPALPWYFTTLFGRHHPGPAGLAATHAYTTALAALGNYYWEQVQQGHQQAVDALAAEEANLLHARRLARTHQQWDQLTGTMQGLHALYNRQGRAAEWARLVDEITPDLVDPTTDGPLPGRGDQWALVTDYRIRLARDGRDWPTATHLLTLALDYNRQDAAGALATDPTHLDATGRNRIRSLAVTYQRFGDVQYEQGQAGCVDSFQQAADLYRRIDARGEQAAIANNLGAAYLTIPALRDLDQAEQYYREDIALTGEHDQLGRAWTTGQLGSVAYHRFRDARTGGAPAAVLVGHLNTAAECYQQALALLPADEVTGRAIFHNRLGAIYHAAGQAEAALTHYQKSIHYKEAAGDRYGAGHTRYNIALLLDGAARHSDALAYARAALADYASYGPAAATTDADKARQLITRLEQAAEAQP